MAKNTNLAIKTDDVNTTAEELVGPTTDGKYSEAEANAVTTEQAKVVESQVAGTLVLTEVQKTIMAGSTTKSVKIRGLLASGLKRGEVAKLLGIRYQHVRNVEITPVKRVA